ncbi:MAG: protein-glutamate O-methyltransferase CheR [Planctomycetes bacterium]|nr:protein-glutamate O-methyltransferase CheR [Planctomycetota bacterium]
MVQSVVLSDRDFRKISDLVYKHCGINLHTGKKELVRARLAKRLRLGKFKTFQQYMKHVLKDKTGKEFSVLVDSLSTNLTSFFREAQHFEFLRSQFLPAMLEQKRKKHNFKIRAWSAGCSSGEEPYSMAITLLEAVKGKGRWDTKVLATDISTSMLEIAKTGIYDSERIKPVPSLQKQKYLVSHRKNKQKVFEVRKCLRDDVIFTYLNLMNDWPIKGPLDFIFCRNVMIYFDKTTQECLINRFWDLLDSGAVLFTGHSESLTGVKHKFKYIQPTIYMKP